MTFKHTHTINVDPTGGAIKNTIVAEGDKEVQIDKTIADGQSDQLVDLALDVSKIQSMVIKVSGPLTLETNDGAAPDETFAFTAAGMYRYVVGEGIALHFTTDIASLYVTNSSGVPVDMSIRVLLNG